MRVPSSLLLGAALAIHDVAGRAIPAAPVSPSLSEFSLSPPSTPTSPTFFSETASSVETTATPDLDRRAAKATTTTKKTSSTTKKTTTTTKANTTTKAPTKAAAIKVTTKKTTTTAKTTAKTTKKTTTTTKKTTTTTKKTTTTTTSSKGTPKLIVPTTTHTTTTTAKTTPHTTTTTTTPKTTTTTPKITTTTSSSHTTTTTPKLTISIPITLSTTKAAVSTSSTSTTPSTSSTSSLKTSTSTSTTATPSATSTSLKTSTSTSKTSSSLSSATSVKATTTSKTSSSSTSASASATSSVTIYSKRGLSFNQANLTQPFANTQNSQVSWAYNWFYEQCDTSDTSCASYNTDLEYIPMLYNDDSGLLSTWNAKATAAIASGSTALFSFNEPDLCGSGSACMNVSVAVETYQQYMQPLAGKALLGAPAVTNGESSTSTIGLDYLSDFIAECTNCTIDFVNVHWYSNVYAGAAYFETFINQTREVAGGRPIWITEFGFDNTYSYTDAQLQAFLQTVMPWLDAQSDVAKYAYFMDAPGLLVTEAGTALSANGIVYNNYTTSTTSS